MLDRLQEFGDSHTPSLLSRNALTRLLMSSVIAATALSVFTVPATNEAWAQEKEVTDTDAGAEADAETGAETDGSDGSFPAAPKEDWVTIPDVVVEADRSQLENALSPGVVTVAYPKEIKGEHKSLPELLDQIPGVFVRRVAGTGHYSTASIRGSAPSQVNIYIDGVPFNTASQLAADLSTIPISNVERVEVYRGTTPARFSGAPLGGAINIVTKRPKGIERSLSVGARSFIGRQVGASVTAPLGTGAVMLGMNHDRSKGNFKYTNYVVQQLNDGAKHSDGEPVGTCSGQDYCSAERTRRYNDSKKSDLFLKWQNDNVFAKWAYTYMNRALPEKTWTSPGPGHQNQRGDTEDQRQYGAPHKRQKQGQHDLALGWNDTFGDLGLGVTASALDLHQWYRHLNPGSGFHIGTQYTHHQTRRYGLAGDASYALGDGWPIDHFFELHADWYQETLHSDMNGRGSSSDFIDTFRRRKTNIQLQDTMTFNILGGGLEITPIGRLERMQGPVIASRWAPGGDGDGDYDWQPSGSVSAKVKLPRGWQVFGNYGTYNRYPSFYEIYGDGIWVVPNADSTGKATGLSREFGRNSDIGFGWDGHIYGDFSGSFRATYFERKTKNEITFYSVPLAAKYVNSGDTYTHGGEFEGTIRYGKFADLNFAVTRQEGWYQNDGYHYFGGASTPKTRYPGQKNRTLRTPLLVGNVRLNLHFLDGDLTTFAELKHTGRDFWSTTWFNRPLTTVDAGLHYKFWGGAKLSFGVNDIFNQGPKQTAWLDGDGDADKRIWSECAKLPPGSPEKHECELNPPRSIVPFNNYNVKYPQQGRTVYATLGWTF